MDYCGPYRNRTGVTAMRMQHITTVLTAQVIFCIIPYGAGVGVGVGLGSESCCGTSICGSRTGGGEAWG